MRQYILNNADIVAIIDCPVESFFTIYRYKNISSHFEKRRKERDFLRHLIHLWRLLKHVVMIEGEKKFMYEMKTETL